LEDLDLLVHAAIIQIPLINEQQRLAYQVNVLGTQNVCETVDQSKSVKCMILTGSWHTIGERELSGTIDEEFGFRPDKVEDRARLYALSKMAQESMVRLHDGMSGKIFAVLRMGTVLGVGMPEKTAANVFIDKGLRGEPLTPYKHSMYRPMLYVDIRDICLAYRSFVARVLEGRINKTPGSLAHVVNVYCTKPMTILELAQIVQREIAKQTGSQGPSIDIVDTGQQAAFEQTDKNRISVDLTRAKEVLGLTHLREPEESIEEIIRARLKKATAQAR
jgi:UDP-glucose 4-epimerase